MTVETAEMPHSILVKSVAGVYNTGDEDGLCTMCGRPRSPQPARQTVRRHSAVSQYRQRCRHAKVRTFSSLLDYFRANSASYK